MAAQPLEIGITGGIGSGKSLICKIFSVLGAPIYNADNRAKWLMNNDVRLRTELISAFGPASYNEKGLNRAYLAGEVFSNPQQLELLNSLVHPVVARDYDTWTKFHPQSKYLIKEAALLFESGSYKKLDQVINVSAPEELRIQRVLKRDIFRAKEEIKAIISRQLPEAKRTELADHVIYNDEQHMVLPQVLALHNSFIGKR